MKRVILLTSSVSLALLLALNGCGGGSASADGTNIRGKAIDPYLSGSTVCLDINDNGTCEVNEPSTYTDTHGQYTVQIAQEHHHAHHALVVSGGTDIGTNAAFTGTLTAVKVADQTTQNITPLTTLVEARYRYCEAQDTCHETLNEITASLSSYLGLTEEQINADIVELANNGNDNPLKTALALEASAESHNTTHPHKFYEQMGEHGFPTGHNWKNDIKTLMPKEYGLITAIMDIDESTLEEVKDANDTATDTHIRAHTIAQYVHGLLHQTESDIVDAGVTAGETAANAGVEAGNAAANAGVNAGETAANAGVEAGNAVANAGVNAGETAANAGVEAGNAAANAGVNAGETAANAGVEAGNAAANAGVTAGETAANAGVEAGNAAANAGVNTGETAANAGVDTAVTGTRPFGR